MLVSRCASWGGSVENTIFSAGSTTVIFVTLYVFAYCCNVLWSVCSSGSLRFVAVFELKLFFLSYYIHRVDRSFEVYKM